MLIRNITPHDREVAPAGHPPFHVPAGGTAEVPDDLGSAMCDQSDVWAADKPVKTDKKET